MQNTDLTTTTGNNVATIQSNRLLAHGNKYATASLGRLLKFNKGTFECQEKTIPLGKHFIAQVGQTAEGWVKFDGEALVEQKIGKIIDGFEAPPRSELDCQDQSKWQIGRDGRPRDPWLKQMYLPLMSVDNEDEIFTFVTATAGGFSAIGKLTQAFARRNMDALPIVELATEEYRHRSFGKIAKPRFTIIRWTDEAPPVEYPPFDVIHDEPPANLDDDLPF